MSVYKQLKNAVSLNPNTIVCGYLDKMYTVCALCCVISADRWYVNLLYMYTHVILQL